MGTPAPLLGCARCGKEIIFLSATAPKKSAAAAKKAAAAKAKKDTEAADSTDP